MNLHGLRLFYEVGKHQSVTKAAESLHISQPAVTAQIKKFEQAEGVQLLVASGRGIKLTRLGEALFQKATQLFEMESEIEALLSSAQQKERRTIQLAGNYLATHVLLPDRLAAYRQEKPAQKFQIATLNSADALQSLLSGQVELALIGKDGYEHPDLWTEAVLVDRLCFVVSATHPLSNQKVSLQALVQESFIGREGSSFTQQALISLLAKENVERPTFMLTFNNSRDAVQALFEQQAVHYCAYSLVGQLIASGALQELDVVAPVQDHVLYLCWRKKYQLSQVAQEFKTFILKNR